MVGLSDIETLMKWIQKALTYADDVEQMTLLQNISAGLVAAQNENLALQRHADALQKEVDALKATIASDNAAKESGTTLAQEARRLETAMKDAGSELKRLEPEEELVLLEVSNRDGAMITKLALAQEGNVPRARYIADVLDEAGYVMIGMNEFAQTTRAGRRYLMHFGLI